MATAKPKTPARDRSHDDSMAEVFQADPTYAAAMLNSILADGDQGELLIALRQITAAFGGVSTVAQKAHLNQTQLYRTLSAEGNPALSTLTAVLKVMDLRLAVEPIKRRRSKAAA
jgi:probable addiction module antidote protein